MSAPAVADALAPIREALRLMTAGPASAGRTGTPAVPLNGLARGLRASGGRWVSASTLADGSGVDDLLGAAAEHWHAAPHTAAALAWKSYAYWVSLPAVLGYAVSRRVPLLRPEAVQVRWSVQSPFVQVALASAEVAVLATDPLATPGTPKGGIVVVDDDRALLAQLRRSLLEEHLTPVLEELHGRVRVGRRSLWGSVASGVAYALSRGSDVIAGSTLDTATEMLDALDLADLVDVAAAPVGLTVARRTCCLAFTLPQPKVCTGCCIR